MFRCAAVFESKRKHNLQSLLCDKIFVLEFEEMKTLWLLSILNLQAAVFCEMPSIATPEYISTNRHFLKATPIFLGLL